MMGKEDLQIDIDMEGDAVATDTVKEDVKEEVNIKSNTTLKENVMYVVL